MRSKNNDEVISEAKPHTIKKFELIAEYVKGWMHKLLNYDNCEKLFFIDCMCNSGEYRDIDGNTVDGTGVRVANLLHDASFQYPTKEIHVFLNDIDERKIHHIEELLPRETHNFKLHIYSMDANELLKNMGRSLMRTRNTHTLLVYDPYQADVDWEAVMPFLNTWGEVILNHMVSDSIRAVSVAKKPDTIKKYEKTYQTDFINLIPFGNNRKAYEERIEEIIASMRMSRQREFYIAAFPFFNRNNSVIYNLIHYSNNPKGFSLFKKVAWQTFGGKSSSKNTHGMENQLTLEAFGDGTSKTIVDEDCYYVKDIADYLQSKFEGQEDVPLNSLWTLLEGHPVFPSDGFRPDIKHELKKYHNAVVGKTSISFKGRK